MLVNFVAAHVLERTTSLSWFADFAIGFMLGGISNYILNRLWTFRLAAEPVHRRIAVPHGLRHRADRRQGRL